MTRSAGSDIARMNANARRRYAERRTDPQFLARHRATYQRYAARHPFRHARRLYGITADEVAAMLVGQDQRCACCQLPFRTRTPIIDHDHTTGRVRGLLCRRCNTLVGYIESALYPRVLAYVVRQ